MRAHTAKHALPSALVMIVALSGCAGFGHSKRATSSPSKAAEPSWEIREACSRLKDGVGDLEKASDEFTEELGKYEDYVADNLPTRGNGESMPASLKGSVFHRYTAAARDLENLLAKNRAARDDVFRVSQTRLHEADDPLKFDIQEDAAATGAIDDQFQKIVAAREYIDKLFSPLLDPEAKLPGPRPSGYEYDDHKVPIEAYQSMACART
ncbi:hypothetical protein [Segniliparus rugosus]|uniref:Uncharacterized protein n=1 Tax=Segniliparus rugosus (strain ATCC BAA-974 / DSM 45345 / CCUG 50838 / CIP 108380 / JCM 13579 / CDC 945) TaxID=679197 RepID=E5XQJ4_SEGRC|nr:hypothetical protein [Segniliparus rugosus]EFV13368.1 hypothetical protein HMPREF9336_01757 [Segniliparus rugosus ATCC BAA-974]